MKCQFGVVFTRVYGRASRTNPAAWREIRQAKSDVLSWSLKGE